MKTNFLHILTDIRFWIVLFFAVRLHGITRPPLEFAHNWRQTTVCMVSRNFLETDANIFYPRLDIAGEKTGITGMEFPVFNYLIFLVSKIFGYEHWYGRLINLIISSIGMWYFYLLLKKYFTIEIAKNATFILIFSIWFSYSRKIMPDTFSMSFILAALYYGTNYFDNPAKKINLILYFLLASIGILSKLTSGYLLVLFLVFIFKDNHSFQVKLNFILTSLILLVFPAFWYFYWVPNLVTEYGFWHFFMGKPILAGFKELIIDWSESLKKFYSSGIKYIAFGFFTIGLIKSIFEKNKLLRYVFSICTSAFFIVMCKSGWTFAHHEYYIIPFVPVMCLFAASGLSLINNSSFKYLILIAIGFEGFVNQKHDFRIKEPFANLISLEKDLDQFSSRTDLIMINSGLFPTPMYFAHRKGWVESNEKIIDEVYMKAAINLGLKYVVILKRVLGTEIKLDYPCIFNSQDYAIYKVSDLNSPNSK